MNKVCVYATTKMKLQKEWTEEFLYGTADAQGIWCFNIVLCQHRCDHSVNRKHSSLSSFQQIRRRTRFGKMRNQMYLTFESKCSFHIRMKVPKKVRDKAWLAIMIGYCISQQAYKMWGEALPEVVIAREESFEEVWCDENQTDTFSIEPTWTKNFRDPSLSHKSSESNWETGEAASTDDGTVAPSLTSE